MLANKDATKYRVLQLGAGPTALSCLDALASRFQVVGLVRGSSGDLERADETIDHARALGIPVFRDDSLEALEAYVQELTPDCVVVSSHARILPARFLARCRFVNVHYAPLPRYRGRANVNWAIINHESFAGITIHTISPGLDAGRILFQDVIKIQDDDDAASLYERLNAIQHARIADTILAHLQGYEGMPQDETQATYGCTRIPEDGEIDWSRPAGEIERLVRALVSPFPGAFTYYEGQRLTIWHAEAMAHPLCYEGRVEGRVIAVSRKEGTVDVLGGEGAVRLFRVQRDGREPEHAARVISSVRGTLGLRTSDLLARLERLERLIMDQSWQRSDTHAHAQ